MAYFDFISFVIGLLLGMVMMLLLVWIAYMTRVFLFTYCAKQARKCAGTDYYNDPGDALSNNPNLTVNDMLFVNDNDEMFYKRVPATTACVPESNQIVYMKYPQYCTFFNDGGSNTWKETAFNSNIYRPVGFTGPTVETVGNCEPKPDQEVISGKPIIRWDPNPIQ